ncbi:MAG: hypothetical protein WBD01_11840 [Salaquimonas sp.]
MKCSALFGSLAFLASCASPQVPEARQAGYYSAKEKSIRAACEKEIYGPGVEVGDKIVYSVKERSDYIEGVVKSDPRAMALVLQGAAEGKSVVDGRHVTFNAKMEADVEAIDKRIDECEIAKGSTFKEKFRKIVEEKKRAA